ncbi:MAG: GDP-mannose 4,6-dehydratase [Bacteroidia bacterium]|nr:GDP-mannose 4,6-dehydratase [Bacteroidia bacterium]
MKKVLVTGGAGFIGSALIAHLQEREYEIFVIDNLSFGNRNFIQLPDSNFYEVDLRDREAMFSTLAEVQPNWVIHLAAIHFIPYCNKNPYEAFDVNVNGTINLYDAAEAVGSVEKMFFASTAAVYPIYDDPIHENKALGPLDVYGLSKLTGERLSNEFFLKTNIPTVVCRFFNAFGPRETNPHLIPEIQQQLNEGKRTIQLGNLEPKRDFIHTSDMARAVRLLMEANIDGIDTFNLGQGMEYSVREVVEAFERQLGEKITITQNPARMRKSDRMHLLADINKLTSQTGWKPLIGLDEGIATLIELPAYEQ